MFCLYKRICLRDLKSLLDEPRDGTVPEMEVDPSLNKPYVQSPDIIFVGLEGRHPLFFFLSIFFSS